MKLAELTAYAAKKFQIPEQHKWADFPGFSVLAEPDTGKWIALLMRQWDQQTGQEIERCDLRCGQPGLPGAAFLTPPFRMKGRDWVGIRFDDSTDAETVFRLLDRAVYAGARRGFTVVLDEKTARVSAPFGDTPLLFTGAQLERSEADAPERILQMRRLYEYGDGSLAQKSRSFFRQGKFMEDYTDDQPYTGIFRRYFPTYHDMNLRQLRGYFTWRTRVREGAYRPTEDSFAYVYLYELLCGIGTTSPEESLQKLREFEKGYLDAGRGGEDMRKNLRRWMLEYAILHDMPGETVRACADPALLAGDGALAVLRDPGEHTDAEVFSALCVFAEKKPDRSPVLEKDRARGERLFAAVWRGLTAEFAEKGGDLFASCFGARGEYPWRPLGNAVFYEERPHPVTSFTLNPCRSYHCRGRVWLTERYDKNAFDSGRFQSLLHETDRQLRKYLKTGRYLRERPDGAWAAPAVMAVIEAEKAAALEQARPKITIDLSGLERIRQDAVQTRDSLLIGDELEEAPKAAPQQDGKQKPAEAPAVAYGTLDALHTQIVLALLRGESARELIREHHLMPAVVADTVNEAFLDEIGDSVLECDGGAITLVEDYREELAQILGGTDR